MRKTAIQTFTRLLLIVIIALASAPTAPAQEKLKFSILEFREDPTDLSANNPEFQKYDANGNRYSIIKVTSDNPNDDLSEYTFDFGMLKHTSEMHDDVLWLYVQQKARKVTITRKGYATVTKDLPQAIKAGANYVMRLSSETPVIHMQMVHFNVIPADSHATILIKNVLPDAEEEKLGDVDKDGSLAKNLPFGTYTYTITSSDYYREDGRITLNDENKTLVENVTLKPRYAAITLKASKGTEIYVDGERKGVGTWMGKLRSGTHTIESRKTNHASARTSITVEDNVGQEVQLPEPQPINGTLSVTSTPNGADIYVDGQKMGVTPMNLPVIIGRHNIKIVKEGFNSDESIVEVKEKQTTELQLSLKNIGKIEIESDPGFADVKVDGKKIGEAPCTYEGAIGEHTLYVQYPGYKSVNKKFKLRSMNDKETVRLQKMHIKPYDFYIDAGFEIGAMNGPSGVMGFNIANVNFQADFTYGLNKKDFYLLNLSSLSESGEKTTLKPSINFGANVGYRIVASPIFSITPQVGFRHTMVGSNRETKGYNTGFSAGARFVYAFADNFGLSLTPRYVMKVAGSESLKTIGATVSGVENLGCGFACSLAFSIAF